jgi:hypothetical protein
MRPPCRALDGVSAVREFYTERENPGLGKNAMTERDRREAVRAYRFHTLYYALLGLADRLDGADPASLLAAPSADANWEHRRRILVEDFEIVDPVAALRLLPELAARVARDVEAGKAKDDDRGVRVIDDYADVHPPVERDRVVRQARDEAAAVRAGVERCLRELAVAPFPDPGLEMLDIVAPRPLAATA